MKYTHDGETYDCFAVTSLAPIADIPNMSAIQKAIIVVKWTDDSGKEMDLGFSAFNFAVFKSINNVSAASDFAAGDMIALGLVDTPVGKKVTYALVKKAAFDANFSKVAA